MKSWKRATERKRSKWLEQAQPDILLLDIGMPILDGFGVVRGIRENPQLAALPALAVTAYAMPEDRKQIHDAGFDGYLSKPIDSRLLFKQMDLLLQKSEGHGAQPDQGHGHANAKAAADKL